MRIIPHEAPCERANGSNVARFHFVENFLANLRRRARNSQSLRHFHRTSAFVCALLEDNFPHPNVTPHSTTPTRGTHDRKIHDRAPFRPRVRSALRVIRTAVIFFSHALLECLCSCRADDSSAAPGAIQSLLRIDLLQYQAVAISSISCAISCSLNNCNYII